jgi:hypothetical protein
VSTRPTEHDCGYVDGKPGNVIWSGNRGRCDRCGRQFEDVPALLDTEPTA